MQFFASRVSLLILLLTPWIYAIEIESDSISSLFQKMDSNQDGTLSKKEFYYALMEDEFEVLSSKHSVPSLELEFENQDENGDKKISPEEWGLIFFPRSLRSESEASDFVKSEIGKAEQVQVCITCALLSLIVIE